MSRPCVVLAGTAASALARMEDLVGGSILRWHLRQCLVPSLWRVRIELIRFRAERRARPNVNRPGLVECKHLARRLGWNWHAPEFDCYRSQSRQLSNFARFRSSVVRVWARSRPNLKSVRCLPNAAAFGFGRNLAEFGKSWPGIGQICVVSIDRGHRRGRRTLRPRRAPSVLRLCGWPRGRWGQCPL